MSPYLKRNEIYKAGVNINRNYNITCFLQNIRSLYNSRLQISRRGIWLWGRSSSTGDAGTGTGKTSRWSARRSLIRERTHQCNTCREKKSIAGESTIFYINAMIYIEYLHLSQIGWIILLIYIIKKQTIYKTRKAWNTIKNPKNPDNRI